MLGRTVALQLHRTSSLNPLLGRFFSAAPEAPHAGGGISSSPSQGLSEAGAPWPWLDPSAPQVLPYYVKTAAAERQSPLSDLGEALKIIQARVEANKDGTSPKLSLSGRPVVLKGRDESVELIIRVNADTSKADHALKGVLALPYGTGQKCTIGVIAAGAQADAARAAGADVVGGDPLIDQIIADGKKAVTFDTLIVTPDFMKSVARAGRVLGPKGLMPSAKVGTLTDDVVGAIKQQRLGVLTYRADKYGIVHSVVGKASYKSKDLVVNMGAFVQALLDSRPKDVPGSGVDGYFKTVALKATQTSSVRLTPSACLEAAEAFRAYKAAKATPPPPSKE